MLLHLRKRRLSPTGRLNLGFITKGKFSTVLITPSFGAIKHIKNFWRRCRGERSLLRGESLTLNLFILLLFFAFLFYFVYFILYQNPQKNSLPFIVVIFIACCIFVQWLLLKIPSC